MTRISDEGREIDEVWLQTMFEGVSTVRDSLRLTSLSTRTTACCTASKILVYISWKVMAQMGNEWKQKSSLCYRSALIAAMSPTMISLVAGASQAAAHSHNPNGPPTTVPPCDFDHPTSLPPHASANAADAHDDRGSHCPTHTRGQP